MAKRKPKTAKILQKHAYVRAAQRYGICLDEEQQAAIVEDIQNNRCKFIERQSRDKTAWEVKFEGHYLSVVYDRRYKSLVTVLPQSSENCCSQNGSKEGEKKCPKDD